MAKGKNGGVRAGAGRKKKEPTVMIGIRVPLVYRDQLKEEVKKTVTEWIAREKIKEAGRVIEFIKTQLGNEGKS